MSDVSYWVQLILLTSSMVESQNFRCTGFQADCSTKVRSYLCKVEILNLVCVTCNFRHLNAFLCCNGLQCPSIFVYFCKAPKTSYFWETEVLGSSFDFYNSFRTHFHRHTKLPKQHKTPQCITRWIFELSFENAHLHFWVPLWHSILF